MNGEPLGPDHGAPFRLIVPHWYAVASVKWLKRIDVLTEPYTGEFQTGHYMYEWPDRPHGARRPHARARPHHRPRARRDHRRRHLHGARKGLVRHRPGHHASTSASPAKATGTRRSSSRRTGPYQWQDWSFDWEATDIGRHTLRARATDAAGNVQPDVPPWNRLGYGNNAIEVIYVDRR